MPLFFLENRLFFFCDFFWWFGEIVLPLPVINQWSEYAAVSREIASADVG